MTTESIAPPVGMPQFSGKLIDAALVAAQDSPDDFRHEQLGLMSRHNNPLRAFFEEKIAAFGGRGESLLCDRWMIGYTLGHSALRSALPDSARLPNRDRTTLHGVAMYLFRNPLSQTEILDQDYAAHPFIKVLLGELEKINDGNVDGAGFIFAAYSRWANPGRPARVLPRLSEEALQPDHLRSRRQQVFAPKMSRFNLGK